MKKIKNLANPVTTVVTPVTTKVVTPTVDATLVHILVNSSLVVFSIKNNKTFTFYADSRSFKEVQAIALDRLQRGDFNFTKEDIEELEALDSLAKKVAVWSKDQLVVNLDDFSVTYKDETIPEELSHFILKAIETVSDFDTFIKPWSKFVANLKAVQSREVYQNIFKFLRHNDLEIDDDGNILAFKVVRQDFKDIYTGKIDNSVGKVVTEDRSKISSNPNQTCSYGLHACAFSYLKHYGRTNDNIVQISVNLSDIVSVPIDYDGTKIRCCKYVVTKHLGTLAADGTLSPV